jgi:formylglycine-generating enzyme required for sulfatase activity
VAFSMFTACSGEDTPAATLTVIETPPGTVTNYTAGTVAFDTVYVPGGITFPTGTDDSGSATVTNAYEIGETEVTYELWSAVYTWAISNGYAFANAGTMGDGTGDTNQHPVTTVNWRDSMVWMNALTEYYNDQNGTSLTCVYTYSSTIIRDSRDANATACDGAVASTTADGFRLLTSNEYELAARYIDDANSNNILDAGEYYPGNYASGATADYNDATATGLQSV